MLLSLMIAKEISISISETINGRLRKWIIEKFNGSFEDVVINVMRLQDFFLILLVFREKKFK